MKTALIAMAAGAMLMAGCASNPCCDPAPCCPTKCAPACPSCKGMSACKSRCNPCDTCR